MSGATVAGADLERDTVRAAAPARPIRVLHVITRMIVGGAQENTMLSCSIIDRERFPSELLTGPQTGLEGEILSEARARGVPVHVEPALVREVNPLQDLRALARLVRFFERGRYDVVHTHSSKAGVLGRVAARLAGVPVVIHTVHGWGFFPGQSRPVFRTWVELERMCARWTHGLVFVAQPDLDEAAALRIGRRERYHVIRSGIEIASFRDVTLSRAEARARLGLPEDAFTIGCVGRLTPQKSPLDLVASFERVAARRPDARLVLVGDGYLRPEVEARLAAAGLSDRALLTGLRRDVPELLRAFDVLALSSRWEGLPRVFPQAMAARLPIVATKVDGAVEAVQPGVNGWLVEVGDVEAFADRLLDLAADPARARAMGERGFERVEEYSASTMVRQLEDLYARLALERGVFARR